MNKIATTGRLEAKARVLATVASIALVAAGAADAYVLPGAFILRKVAGKLVGLRTVEATLRAVMFDEKGDVRGRADEKLWLASPDRYRLESRVGSDLFVEVQDGTARTVARAGKPERSEAQPNVLAALLVGGDIKGFAKRFGIDAERVSLARFAGHVCWRLGERGKSRLLVDKDRFVPIRLVLVTEEGGAAAQTDIALLDWDPTSDLPFPRRLEVRAGARIVKRAAIWRLQLGQPVPDGTFSMTAPGPGGGG